MQKIVKINQLFLKVSFLQAFKCYVFFGKTES